MGLPYAASRVVCTVFSRTWYWFFGGVHFVRCSDEHAL
jgi:hypothetical protein